MRSAHFRFWESKMSIGKFLRKKGAKAIKRRKAPSTLKTGIKVAKAIDSKRPKKLSKADANMQDRLSRLKTRKSVKAL